MFEEEAEKHWEYINGLLTKAGVSDEPAGLLKYLYVRAMTHGYKHGIDAALLRSKSPK